MRKVLLLAGLSAFLAANAEATLPVVDYSQIAHNIVAQTENYAQYVQQTFHELTLVQNSITQIQNQVIALERFGNPQYYVNLLVLNSFMATASSLTSGAGQTIAQVRGLANGASALAYMGQGLYTNLTGTLDRWGNPVRYYEPAFNKFAAVNTMVDQFDAQQRTYNTQIASLQQQLTTALQNLNGAKDLVSTQKYAAQVQAINAQINALHANSTLTGQAAAVQQAANQNDAARMQEATRQQEIQERTEDIQMEAKNLSNLIGGNSTGGSALP